MVCAFSRATFLEKYFCWSGKYLVWKSAVFNYGLENGRSGNLVVWKVIRSGKLSLESDGLEICGLEKDVAPVGLECFK